MLLLKNSCCPIDPPITILTPPQAFPLVVLRIFKIAGTASVVESVFRKQKLLSFATMLRNLTRAWYVPKSSCSRNFKKTHFNRSYMQAYIIQFAKLLKANS